MPDSPTYFNTRAERYDAVRELVNKLVATPEDRTLLMCAIAEYGYAAACKGIDDTIGILDEAQDRQ